MVFYLNRIELGKYLDVLMRMLYSVMYHFESMVAIANVKYFGNLHRGLLFSYA